MANVDYAFGFRCISDPSEVVKLEIDASNATTIGKGDPLTMEADGGYKRSATGELVAYIAQSFKNSNGESISYLPASTAGTITGIKVVPGQLWAAQADSGTALTSAAINATCDITAANADTNTGVSKYELDSSNVGTGQAFRIMGLLDEPGNSFAEHAVLFGEFSENASTSNTSV